PARVQHAFSWMYTGETVQGNYIKLAHRFVARQTQYREGMDYVAPPPAYHLFDMVASKQFKTDTDASWQVMLSVENLFNRSYKDYMDRFRYFAHQIGRNANIKISYQFYIYQTHETSTSFYYSDQYTFLCSFLFEG